MTDLIDRMRTCAAYIVEHTGQPDSAGMQDAMRDAAELLIEASNAMTRPAELMRQQLRDEQRDADVFAPPPLLMQPAARRGPRPPNACPRCDSRAHKRVRREGDQLMIVCPVCAKEWQYKRP